MSTVKPYAGSARKRKNQPKTGEEKLPSVKEDSLELQGDHLLGSVVVERNSKMAAANTFRPAKCMHFYLVKLNGHEYSCLRCPKIVKFAEPA